ncbi:malto-oligosyltrehalose synthase [soil metagenome]
MPSAVPSSTYRLHLTDAFTLDDAAALVDHLDRLGIDWAYASPIQTFPPGATHGYHMLDPDEVNPELGGEQALSSLSAALQQRDMGLLLDIVPNHMAASPDNAWWADLLRRGPDSPHARTFDVDFGDPDDPTPMVLPVLGVPLQQALADGEIAVQHDDGEPVLLVHGGLRLPLHPGTDPEAPIALVLEAQHYRLHLWHEGEKIINWRRFFAVNELAGLRAEDPVVFEATHRLIRRLIADDVVQGLRVDHVDGLAGPGAYLQRLRDAVGPDVWLLVEKIIERDEVLPPHWPIAGTTGYEVSNLLAQWLLDRDGHQRLVAAFEQRTGLRGPVATALAESKLHVLQTLFPAEVDTVRRLLGPLDGDPDPEVVASAIRLVTAHLEGYRSYVEDDQPIEDVDRQRLQHAIDAAVENRTPAAEETATADAIHAVGARLLAPEGRRALLRWQQLTGPAAAKGFEDRLLYRHVALSSLCEVGADAGALDRPWGPDEVVAALVARQAVAPAAGTTTSTHDTKRSEDIRAVIHVLAEAPADFTDLMDELTVLAEAGPPAIDDHAKWLLTQSALAVMAVGRDADSTLPRLIDYAGKALREAEVHTGHADPDGDYEARVEGWLTWLLAEGRPLKALDALAQQITTAGLTNALSQLVLKLVAPGVPDIYRGTEVWDDSLVDPDNRRRMDVEGLGRVLQRVESVAEAGEDVRRHVTALRDSWQDGALKMHVTRAGLRLRRKRRALFLEGHVSAPTAEGSAAEHVAALRRRGGGGGGGGHDVVAVATRLPYGLAGQSWAVGTVWGDTTLEVPDAGDTLLDVLTGRTVPVSDGRVRLTDALAVLPVAMLIGG